MLVGMSENMPERMPGDMQRMSGRIPDDTSEIKSKEMPEMVSDRMSGDMRRMREGMSERISEVVPERMSDRMSGDLQRMSGRISEASFCRMLPVSSIVTNSCEEEEEETRLT